MKSVILLTFLIGLFPIEVLGNEKILHREWSKRSFNRIWTRLGHTEKDSLKWLLIKLKSSKTGKKLIRLAKAKAQREGKSLLKLIKGGEGSMTDTTLVRRFSPDVPTDVVYRVESQIFLNRELLSKDALLDLAHELTHFVFREPFNPYGKSFSPKDFVTSTIEGKGGEVDAFLMECKVLKEIYPISMWDLRECGLQDKTYKEGRLLNVKKFYQLGRYHKNFKKKLKEFDISEEKFPHAGKRQAEFISSAYGLPYPLAALEEYKIIMQSACLNEERRLSYYYSEARKRAPASLQFQRLKNDFDLKCQDHI